METYPRVTTAVEAGTPVAVTVHLVLLAGTVVVAVTQGEDRQAVAVTFPPSTSN